LHLTFNDSSVEKFKEFLKSIVPLSDEEFGKTIHYFTGKRLNKDEYFIRQGEICRQIGFIMQGGIRTFYHNQAGEEVTSCFCTENDFTTSYKSFILREPSELELQAIEDTLLLVISYENLDNLYKESPTWQTIGRKIAEKEYIAMEKYASVLNNESARQKYLRLLKEQPHVLQKAKIEDIASYLGVSRRTLSRIRKEITGII
jgi:CRP-like cAMP-binding protein